MLHADHEDIGALRGAIVRVLCRTFDVGELRRFIARLPASERVLPELPGYGAGLAELAHAFVDIGLRHGLFDEQFITYLIDERPRRREEFESLREFMDGAGAQVSGARRSAFELRVRLGRLLLLISLGCAALMIVHEGMRSLGGAVPLEEFLAGARFEPELSPRETFAPRREALPRTSDPVPPPMFADSRVVGAVPETAHQPSGWRSKAVRQVGRCRVAFSWIDFSAADIRRFAGAIKKVKGEKLRGASPQLVVPVLVRAMDEAGFVTSVLVETGEDPERCRLHVHLTL
jgi:hypothetical protein